MALLVLLNNFLHDFSAAAWLVGSVILIPVLRHGTDIADSPIARDLAGWVLCLMRWSVGGIIVFGLVRTAAYRTYEWNIAAGQAQIVLLAAKHVLLTGIFLWGLSLYLRTRTLLSATGRDES